ncbi:MAG: Sigma-70, region 4 [Pyrinomonadaceae bacterium]|nr:Sigma-70, region 4 [Pyrinomonadaceae bacterium]
MGNGEHNKCSAALQYCLDNYDWLLKISRSALRARNFPNYMDEGRDVAQNVCKDCAQVSDELWSTADARQAYIYERVRWEANRLYRQRNARAAVQLSDENVPPDRPHRNKLLIALIVAQALSQLSPSKREMIEAFEFEGLTGDELAERLGITPEALRKRMSRAYRDLRQTLKAGDAGPPPPA